MIVIRIEEGITQRPLKICIYGPEGIGKTTLASNFPNSLFVDTEGGTSFMNVRRVTAPKKFDDLIAIVEEVAATPGICGTLVIDTADWAEQICITSVCAKYKKEGLEEFGYGKGYTYLAEEFSRLLAACDKVISAGVNVVVTAHAKMRKFELPDEQGAFDRWEMKLTKQTAPLLKEWADCLFFCNYKSFVVTSEDGGKNKVQGGKRVMFTTHHPCWDAKNRFNLPDELPLDYSSIGHIVKDMKTVPAKADTATVSPTVEKLLQMMEEAKVHEEEVQKVVADRGHYLETTPINEYSDEFINGWVFKHWQRIVQTIEAMPDRLPF